MAKRGAIRTLNLTVATLAAAAVTVPMLTHAAPLGGFAGMDYADRSDVPTNVPHFTADVAAAHPGCTAHIATGHDALTMDRDGNVERVTFDHLAHMTAGFTKAPGAHLYVIGTCR